MGRKVMRAVPRLLLKTVGKDPEEVVMIEARQVMNEGMINKVIRKTYDLMNEAGRSRLMGNSSIHQALKKKVQQRAMP